MPPDLPDRHYIAPVTDEERSLIEQWALNFRRDYHAPMRIPPGLYDALRIDGVNMRNMIADKTLERVNPKPSEPS